MYEAKFSKYITKSHSRFAEPEEITAGLQKTGSSGSTCAGVPLYYDGECLYEDTSDAHTIGVGPTGCKKTRTLVIPLVNSIISAGESAVINDPKGELYKYTGGLARQRGADIRILNFRKPSSSNGWNPLSMPYKYYKMGEEEEAVQAINDFISSVIAPLLEKTVDRYWSDSANSFMVSAALMLMDSVPAAYFNLKNLIQFCYEDNALYLKKMVENMDQSSSAVMGMRPTLDLEAERTKSCIFSTVLSAFSPFMKNNKLLDMLCADDISFTGLGEKQTIIYVIYPDEKTNLNFLVNAFLTQCYEALISISEKDHGGRVPLRVNFVLDEFSNLPAIPNFDNRISEARSHNVRFHLFIQSYGQLQNKYKEHAETILSNCNNWICFSSKEIGFLKTISEICGTEVDYNGREHYLISPSEIQHLKKYDDGAEVVIIKAGEYPFVTKLPDYETLTLFESYPALPLTSLSADNKAQVITFKQWLAGIRSSRFRMPYPAGDIAEF